MTTKLGSKMVQLRPRLALAVAALVAAACVLTMTPAQAQRVVGHDPEGDADFYDIATMSVQHGQERVRFRIHAHDRTPYWYDVLVDTPGGKPWKYLVRWSAYQPHRVWVFNRKQVRTGNGTRCKLGSGREPTTRDVTFSVPVRCLMEPNRLRAKAKSFDDETGRKDHTRWTRWARRG